MTSVQRIQAIFDRADQELSKLATELLTAKDYDGAAAAIEAARYLSAIRNSNQRDAILTSVPSSADAVPKHVAPANSTKTPRRPRKGEYPKFARSDETLIKIGWSKTDSGEYEHKSPKKVLSTLVPALVKVGASGKRFAMEKLLPLKESDGTEIPDYQSYLCLAWLRALGVVQQHGRQGYTVPKKTDLVAAVDTAWQQLPHR